MADRRFTDADLQRWVERGLIRPDQREAVLRDLEAHPPIEPGLTLTTLLYYGGGLLILVAYSIFLGFQWEGMNEAGRIAIAAASLAFFAAASETLLRIGRFRLPGELLQVVTVAVVPLLGYAILDAAGLLPDDPGYPLYPSDAREVYQRELAWARMGLGAAALIAAALAFWRCRSPFLLIAGLAAFTSIMVDASLQAHGDFQDYEWETGQMLAVAATGAAGLIGGFGLHSQTERDYTTWLYIAGLAGLAVGLTPVTFADYASHGWGVLWMASAIALLALSVPLQQRLFAAAGMIAVLAYLGKLVFDIFDSANAALVLILLGVIVVGLGMLYQRYGEQLFARQGRA